jgi:hypothetical protein
MLRKMVLAACPLLLALAAPAMAQQYPPDGGPAPAISDSIVTVGEVTTVEFGGYLPEVPVGFTLFSTPVALGTANADANGIVRFTFTVPPVEPGTHRIEASGASADGPLVQSITFTVTGSGEAEGEGEDDDVAGTTGATGATGDSGDELARTGSNSAVLFTRIAMVCLAVGGVVVLAARRRRDRVSVDRNG